MNVTWSVAFLSVACATSAFAQETHLINDAAHHQLIIRVGPVDIPKMEMMMMMHHGPADPDDTVGMVFPPVASVEIPETVYLTGFSYDVRDSAGQPLSSHILHHLNLIDPEHRGLFLPISRRVLAVGQETGDHSVPGFLLGYPLHAGERVLVSAMLHNPTGVAHHGITVDVRLSYERSAIWPLFTAYPFQLDVAFPAGDKGFDLPPGRFTKSYEGSPAIAGRIMAIGGHAHAYSQELRLEDITTGKVLWSAKPVLKANGDVDHIPIGRLYRMLGVPIYPTHRYRVTVVYDNPTKDTIPDGGMGVVGGLFMPARGTTWPKADMSDPLYTLDRRHYLREVRGRYADIRADTANAGTATRPGTRGASSSDDPSPDRGRVR